MKFLPGIGLDEVGRGAWAGPLVACAVLVCNDEKRARAVRDSKQVSRNERERIALVLRARHAFGTGIVTVEEIDSLGMTRVQTLAFDRALEALLSVIASNAKQSPSGDKIATSSAQGGLLAMTRVMIDGLSVRSHPEWTAIIDGDQKVYSIAAASIIAKVGRDEMMRQLHMVDSRYRFDLHKGYGTALHQRLLAEHGPSIHHRRLFEPIRKLYTNDS